MSNCDAFLPTEMTVPAFYFLLYQGAMESEPGLFLACAIYVLDAEGFLLFF